MSKVCLDRISPSADDKMKALGFVDLTTKDVRKNRIISNKSE